MSYDELRPDDDLSKYVDSFWFYRDTLAGAPVPILPDGCMDLIFDTTSGGRGVVCGTMSHSRMVRIEPGQGLFGIRFRPGVLPTLLDEAASRFRDEVVDLVTVSPYLSCRFSSLQLMSSSKEMRAFCAHLLAEELRDLSLDLRPYSLFSPHLSVRSLASSLGLGVRQLERLFSRHVGISPKRFLQIIRFRRLHKALKKGNVSLAHLALDMGYGDQSHMNREYRRLHPEGERLSYLSKNRKER
ncbi:MAG: hypothetical protein CSA35_06620 [Dethiosulfovibrio peptidovorans]|nr:MAG: hypothetical protein CSA35_06620 [Dethiosulfovibrio peptidovorans]